MDFDSIVREHQAGLRAFIRALGSDEAWVDDIAQEVFLIAYRKQSHFDPEADLGKWLRGIARNVVKGEISKQARRSRLMHHGVSDVLVNLGQDDSGWQAGNSDLIDSLQKCVDALPHPSQGLLNDRYHEGRRAKELAEKMNSTTGAVRKKLQRIRFLVRQCMEKNMLEAVE
jgi:RNA polymerase sigma-70 factor (ECF subfamily)